MRLLAADTTGPELSLALADGERVWTRRAPARGTGFGQDERLFPELRRLLARAGLKLRDLDAVTVPTGPGRFTGIRIGLTFASLLGKSLDVPVAALSLFAAVAARPAVAQAARGRTLCVALPGTPGELYLQCFRGARPAGKPAWARSEAGGPGPELIHNLHPRMEPVDKSAEGRVPRAWLFAGPAASEAVAWLAGAGLDCVAADHADALRPPSAADLLAPARALLASGRLPPVKPLYLKPANYQRLAGKPRPA